jgi:hypothetical protein
MGKVANEPAGRAPWRALAALAVAFALGGLGCAPEIGGRASFPLVSRTTLPNYYEPIATVDEKRCSHIAMFFFGWGDDSNHEALVTDILQTHKGDALIDAELTYFDIPAFFYYQSCARVQGTVVRRSAGPATSPQPGAPASPPPVTPAQPVETSP